MTQRPFSVLACSIQNGTLRLKSYRLNWEPKVLTQAARKLVSLVTTRIVCESRSHSLFRRQTTQQQEQRAGSPRVKILYPKHIVYHPLPPPPPMQLPRAGPAAPDPLLSPPPPMLTHAGPTPPDPRRPPPSLAPQPPRRTRAAQPAAPTDPPPPQPPPPLPPPPPLSPPQLTGVWPADPVLQPPTPPPPPLIRAGQGGPRPATADAAAAAADTRGAGRPPSSSRRT